MCCVFRLSKVMSNKLTDNNPNIADLSDENRPTKLVEKLSELYDNEWTNAYGVLEDRFAGYGVVCILLNIFQVCIFNVLLTSRKRISRQNPRAICSL